MDNIQTVLLISKVPVRYVLAKNDISDTGLPTDTSKPIFRRRVRNSEAAGSNGMRPVNPCPYGR